MEDIKMIKFMTCTECALFLRNTKGAERRNFVREREQLQRCAGCVKIKKHK